MGAWRNRETVPNYLTGAGGGVAGPEKSFFSGETMFLTNPPKDGGVIGGRTSGFLVWIVVGEAGFGTAGVIGAINREADSFVGSAGLSADEEGIGVIFPKDACCWEKPPFDAPSVVMGLDRLL